VQPPLCQQRWPEHDEAFCGEDLEVAPLGRKSLRLCLTGLFRIWRLDAILFVDGGASFFVTDSLVQDQPDPGDTYCAVDSMTTSSTSCSSSHAASERSCSGLLPNIRRVKPELTVNFHVRYDYGEHLLVDIDSGYSVGHQLPPGRERRACCGYLRLGRGLSPLPQGKTTTPNYSLKHARS